MITGHGNLPARISSSGKRTGLIFATAARRHSRCQTRKAAIAARTMTTSALSTPLPLRGSSNDKLPPLIYGTAWKKDRTADLVYQALKAGFRAIDTAAQPRHYQEHLVGEGIRRAINEGIVKRKDLFIQTKYTPISSQDSNNLPYDPGLPIPDQIHASIASSLKNFNTGDSEPYLDSVLLHSPLRTLTDTILAFETLNYYVQKGQIRYLGISNTTLPILIELNTGKAGVKPSVVQNRFYGDTRYEVQMRKYCREHGIIFQSFWTLSGNPRLVKSPIVGALAEKAGVSRQVALYALVRGLEGIAILDGTTDEDHMKEDLEGLEIVERWAMADGQKEWAEILDQFKIMIHDV